MNETKKIVGINLGILLVYSVLAHLLTPAGDNYRMLGIAIMLAVAIGVQVVVNLIIAIVFFVQKKPPKGKAFLLASVAVLVIGFSTCYGGTVWA